MLKAMGVLQVLSMGKDQDQTSKDGNPMAHLLRHLVFQQNSQENKEQSCDSSANDPGKAMLSIARNEGQRRSEEDNEADDDMNPSRMGINRNGREK